MSNITLTQEELDTLKNGIRKKYTTSRGIPKNRWNSNPNNYLDLQEDITEHTQSIAKKRFLKSFFYESLAKKEYTIKLENAEILYQYAFSMSRNKFLLSQDEFVIYIGTLPTLRKLNAKNIREIELIDSYELISLLDSSKVVLTIDQSFLENKSGLELLRELFIIKNCEVFHDHAFNSLEFRVSEDVFADGVGKNKEFSSIYPEDLEVIMSFLRTIKSRGIHAGRGKIDDAFYKYHYVYQKGLKENEQIGYLQDAYLETVLENTEINYMFLCVISFYQFFDSRDDEARMLTHFTKFNKNLKNHFLSRVFTIPCIKDKAGNLVSSYKDEISNILMFQYLYLNSLSDSETFIFLYDKESKISTKSKLLLQEDYVLRIKNDRKINSAKELIYEDVLQDVASKISCSKEDQTDRLYMALPQDSTRRNKLIIDSEINSVIRYYADFFERVSIFSQFYSESDVEMLQVGSGRKEQNSISLDTKSNKKLRTILKITSSNINEFALAKERAQGFWDKVNILNDPINSSSTKKVKEKALV